MGVVLWYQVGFPGLNLRISSDVYSGDFLDDAEISVSYGVGQPGKFEIRFKNLALQARAALTAALAAKPGNHGGVDAVVSLGYLDDPSSRVPVLTGFLDTLEATARFPPLGALLTGYETASYALLTATDPAVCRAGPDGLFTPAELAAHILDSVGVPLAEAATPTQPRRAFNLDAENAFNLLDALAERFQAEILVQDGTAQFGMAVTHPPGGPAGLPGTAAVQALVQGAQGLLTGEDTLIAVDTGDRARLAEFKPVQLGSTSKQRVITDLPKAADLGAFDFTVLGVPSLRAGQLIAISVQGYDNPAEPYRILQITHSFSPDSGYVCTGRAVKFQQGGPNRPLSEKARRGSPLAIADRLAGKIKEAGAIFPSVDVGRIREAKPAGRVATLFYSQEPSSQHGSPSVDLEIPEGQAVLLDKPLASPFAWHNVGLSVPVYPGMRALLNEVRDLRDDSVVTGFLWANTPQMDRPKAAAGDWWLCLPTEVSGSPPQPQGKGANDLIAGDGRRVVEVAGLKILVGKDLCSPVGDRPAEGDPDVLLISHKSGTTIEIAADGGVTIDGKGQSVALSCGGVTMTVGSGKVSIS
jgi:hypothetical protein